MAKGKIIIEGAKVFCTNSAANNSKATAVPIKVTSQKKKIGKNKYFAQEKPVATFLDDKAENFNNGQGFGDCITPDGKKLPCLAKCQIKYTGYYENVDFNKSMKVLLDSSTGDCPGYGKPGKIQFADSGQKGNVSQIDVKEADAFSVVNASPQWETKTAETASVKKITISTPALGKPEGTYYFIKEIGQKNILGFQEALIDTKISLKAEFSGDENKITWALFKGTGTKDKVKTFVGIGAAIKLNLSVLFKDLDEGKYRIEAYGKNAGDPNCNIIIEYIKDQIKSIEPAGKLTVKNVPIPFKINYKANAVTDAKKILNTKILGNNSISPIVNWKVLKDNAVLYDSSHFNDTSLVKVEIASNFISILPVATITFKNHGKYTIKAYTDKDNQNPHKVEVEVKEMLNVQTISHNGSGLYRYNDIFEVKVERFTVDILPKNTQLVQWYLSKGTTRLREFEQSTVSKQQAISKRIDALLFNDAKTDNNYFGTYKIEADGRYMTTMPDLIDTKHYAFEVIRNQAQEIKLPTICPTGAKIKVEAFARIPQLKGDEKMIVYSPSKKVIDNNDGTFTFTENGEYTINAYLTGENTLAKEVSATIKVATPELIKALWAYNTGYKRTETGYKEESYGFVEIKGLENQTIAIKIWVKGDGDSFFKEPDKYVLEEQKITLNDKGKAQFKITTDDKYKEKIECVIPPTAENPNPKAEIIFTIEMPTGGSGVISFSENMPLTNGKPVEGTKFIEVLDANETLTLTHEQKIKSIVFSTEDGKNVQQTLTKYGATHKIWVHTVNMIDEELKIDVLKEVPAEGMKTTDNITYTHESKQTYPSEKVGVDGLLEVSFYVCEDWAEPKQNIDYYIAQVSKKAKDPADDKKEVYIFLKSQVIVNDAMAASLEHDIEMEKMGIKAQKADGTALTQEEKIALRKKFIQYETGALKVSQVAITEEAIKNNDVFVEVESAEIENKKIKTCYCDKNLTEDEVKEIIKSIKGSEVIFNHKDCTIKDKTIKSFTLELNMVFTKYNINKCIQKITFLAQAFHESDNFNTAEEYPSNHNSSKSVYKGRGLIQMTGVKAEGSEFYNEAGPYEKYANRVGNQEIISKPELIAQELKYAVDSAGWMWSEVKKTPNWTKTSKVEAIKWKADYFKDGIGKSLNELAIVMENVDEDKYFYLQSKILNGYSKDHKLEKDPNGWSDRKSAFSKLKSWFKYNKNVCKGEVELNLSGRAPWMEIVLQEAKVYGGYSEGGDNVLNKRIKSEYFTIPNEGTTNKSNPSKVSWCAVFASWCLQKAGYANPSSCRALEFSTTFVFEGAGKVDKKLSHMRKITNPVYGCIVVWMNIKDGGGHVAFYYGKTSDGNIIPLGGNQGGSLQFSNRNPNGDYGQKVVGYFLPEDYKDNPADEFTDVELKLDPVLLNKSGLLAKNGKVSGDT